MDQIFYIDNIIEKVVCVVFYIYISEFITDLYKIFYKDFYNMSKQWEVQCRQHCKVSSLCQIGTYIDLTALLAMTAA